jgi:hypothetical protein
MTKTNRATAVAVALVLSGAGIAYSVAGATAPETRSAAGQAAQTAKGGEEGPLQISETVSGGPTAHQATEMSREGLEAVRDIHMARVAINDGYKDNAKKLLDEAHGLLEKVKSEDRPMTVTEQVKIGDKDTHSEKNTVVPDTIPILSELQVVEDFTASPEKSEAVSKAKEHLGKGARDKAVEVLKAADVGLVSQDLSLPLSDTMARVDQTLKLIAGDKLYEANLELKKALDGLVRETTVLVQPALAAVQPATKSPDSAQPKATN